MSESLSENRTRPNRTIPVDPQREYWDRVAWSKNFTHPLQIDLLRSHLPQSARILDFGCGYGRVCGELRAAGFDGVVGVDASAEMIRRGQAESPDLDLRWLAEFAAVGELGAFDAVLLFSVLTCVPARAEQRRLIRMVSRLLHPDGVVYISDLLLQTDARNRTRYDLGAARYADFGVFELDEGVVLRHLDREWLAELIAEFDNLAEVELAVDTMNGHGARGFQYLGRKPAG